MRWFKAGARVRKRGSWASDVQPLSLLMLTLVAVAGGLFVAGYVKHLGMPNAEIVDERIEAVTVEHVTARGEVYVRNLGDKPVVVDTLYLLSPGEDRVLYVHRIVPPLTIPPKSVARTYLPDLPLSPETPVEVKLGTGGAVSPSLRTFYFPPYGGWMATTSLQTSLSGTGVKQGIRSVGLIASDTYVAAGYRQVTDLVTNPPEGRLVVYRGVPLAALENPYIDNWRVKVSGTSYTIRDATAAYGVSGKLLVGIRVNDSNPGVYAILGSFPLPLANGSSTDSRFLYLGSLTASGGNIISSIRALNSSHAIVSGGLLDPASGDHDAFVAFVNASGNILRVDYSVVLGYVDGNGNGADDEVAVKALIDGNMLYVLVQGGGGEPANQGTSSYLVKYNLDTGSVEKAVRFGSPPSTNVTAVDMRIEGGSIYILLAYDNSTSSDPMTLVARLDKNSLETIWARVYNVTGRPLSIALMGDGLGILVYSYIGIVLANVEKTTGEPLWAGYRNIPFFNTNVDITAASLGGNDMYYGIAGTLVFGSGVSYKFTYLIGEINPHTLGRVKLFGISGQSELSFEKALLTSTIVTDYTDVSSNISSTINAVQSQLGDTLELEKVG